MDEGQERDAGNHFCNPHYAELRNKVDDEELGLTVGKFITAAKTRQLLQSRDTQGNSRTLSLILEVRADLVVMLGEKEDEAKALVSLPAAASQHRFVSRLRSPCKKGVTERACTVNKGHAAGCTEAAGMECPASRILLFVCELFFMTITYS